MDNRNVGFLMIGVSLLIGFIIFSFNSAMVDIVNSTCVHGPSCSMWGAIDFQTNVSIGIMGFVTFIGLYLVFFGDRKNIPFIRSAKITRESYKEVLEDLGKDEKKIMETVIDSEGTIFQSKIVEQTGFSKAKVSRLLDKLEAKKLLERRRHGMSNAVVLKA